MNFLQTEPQAKPKIEACPPCNLYKKIQVKPAIDAAFFKIL